MSSKRPSNRGNDSITPPLRSSDRIKRRPSYNGRSFLYSPYHISKRNKPKSRTKASRIAKMLQHGNRALDASNSNEHPTNLRRSKRKRRASSALMDYTSSASFGDDSLVFQKSGSVMQAMKNRINDFNHQEVSSKRKVDLDSNPRREGLRPRSSRSVAREQLKYEAEYHESSDEKVNQNETENGFDINLNEADEHDEEMQEEEDVEEDEDDADGDGDDEEEEGEDNEREDGDEDEDAEEEQEGKKRYDLRNRAEVKRISMDGPKQRLRSPRRVLYEGIGTKDSREVRKSGSRVHKRHRLSRAEDSDDSLLVDEFDQGPVPPWSRGGNRSSAPWLFGGIDLHGPTSWGLNVAASGWGHQSDAFATLSTGVQTAGPSSKGGADIQPLQIDENVSFEDIGGLSEYIDALKEMVFFPLLYPEFFSTYHITPPRGVLLCGPPGTGKTLIARALACAASKAGQKVSFYMRKGADVLSKWVGEAERQLKLLFEEAQRNQPSIIFFDEIDGLAPVRSSKQEQIHNSIVSTLLALMDGLDSRGQVVLIGATNRVDAIDGALRRPGRFDREFNFPLPGFDARAEILNIHTRKWRQPPEKELKFELAACCVGYCGADLKALCTEAAIRAFREKYPQVYTSDDQFVIDVDSVSVEKKHFLEAMATITPAAHRGAIVHSRPLSIVVAPCLQRHLKHVMDRISDVFPPAIMGSEFAKLSMVSFGAPIPLVYRPRILLYGNESSGLDHLGPAVLHELEKFPLHSIGLSSLVSDMSAKTPEEALVHIFGEARRTSPSVLYLPHLNIWWDNAHEQLKAVLLTLLDELPSELPILFLGTSSSLLEAEEGLPTLFPISSSYHLEEPANEERSLFFDQLAKAAISVLLEDVSSKNRNPDATTELPKVHKVTSGLKASEIKARVEAEEHALRRLRMCLRDVCNRLLYDKRFSAFHYPVTDEDAPNYRTIIENPMDIATLLQRVDSAHYLTCSLFLQDIDLIVNNAIVYNGDDYTGSRIVSRAYELRDSVQGMLSQMDPSLVSHCDKISAQGGRAQLPHEHEEPNSSPNVQTGSGGRTCSSKPEGNVDQSMDDVRKDETILGAEGKEESEVDCVGMSSSGAHHMPEDILAELEDAKRAFLSRTKGCGVPTLERMYTRLMKRVFECRQAPVTMEEGRCFLFKLLMEFADT